MFLYFLWKEDEFENASAALVENREETINHNLPESNNNLDTNLNDKNPQYVLSPEKALKKSNSIISSDSLNSTDGLNCCQRFFRPIRRGSLRGGVFSLAAICFDTTSLSFPFAVYYTGLVPGTLMLLLMAGLSMWSLKLLLYAGEKRKIYDYRGLIVDCLGPKMAIIADINNIIFTMGSQCAYLVTMSRFFSEFMKHIFDIEITKGLKAVQMILSMIIVEIPLGLVKDIAYLQYGSMFGSLVLFMALIVMLMEFPFYYIQGKEEGRSIEFFKPPNLNYLDTFSVFLYTFATHNGLFVILNQLNHSNKRRRNKVINRACLLQGLLFLIITYSGYFSLIRETPIIFLSRPALKNFDP